MEKVKKTCNRGHIFYKSSSCPVCPICWSDYYKKEYSGNLPSNLGAPAFRALLNEKIYSLAELSKYTEKEILELHGMGPSSIPLLKKALESQGLSFKK